MPCGDGESLSLEEIGISRVPVGGASALCVEDNLLTEMCISVEKHALEKTRPHRAHTHSLSQPLPQARIWSYMSGEREWGLCS